MSIKNTLQMIKKQYLSMLVAFVLLSCNKRESYTLSSGVYFSFKEEVTTVEVAPTVKSFKLKGDLTAPPSEKFYLRGKAVDVYKYITEVITIDTIKTTARHNLHFKNNRNKYVKGAGTNVHTEFELMPENITSEVKIVFKSIFKFTDGKPVINTTTIILTPKDNG